MLKLSQLRDWIVLPLLSLFVVVSIFSVLHFISHRLYSTQSPTTGCLIMNDPATGVRGVPNSDCWEKSQESPWTEYRFNSCGHRAGMECGPKRAGKYRIVLMGSSFGFGMWVPREKSFAALLPNELSKITGKDVEVYNASMLWYFPRVAALRFKEVLDAHPDLIIWDLTPKDIQFSDQVLPDEPQEGAAAMVKTLFKSEPASQAVSTLFGKTVQRAVGPVLMQHLLYTNRSIYMQAALAGSDARLLEGSDPETGFLRTQYSAKWRSEIRAFDADAASVAEQASKAGIPLVVLFLPNRLLAAMVSGGDWPHGYDPYKLDRHIKAVVEQHGATYVDLLPDMRRVSHPEQDFYPVDGHPEVQGHALFSTLIAKELTTNSSIPELKAPSNMQRAAR